MNKIAAASLAIAAGLAAVDAAFSDPAFTFKKEEISVPAAGEGKAVKRDREAGGGGSHSSAEAGYVFFTDGRVILPVVPKPGDTYKVDAKAFKALVEAQERKTSGHPGEISSSTMYEYACCCLPGGKESCSGDGQFGCKTGASDFSSRIICSTESERHDVCKAVCGNKCAGWAGKDVGNKKEYSKCTQRSNEI